MSLETVTQQIKEKLTTSVGSTLKAKVKFDFGEDGIVFVDNTQSPSHISHEDEEADVTLSCKISTFQGFVDGSKDPNVAFMMGQLKVKGNMGLAMKLNSILED